MPIHRGGATHIECDGQSDPRSHRLNPALIKAVARGYHSRSQLLEGDLGSVSELARKLWPHLRIPIVAPKGGRPGRAGIPCHSLNIA